MPTKVHKVFVSYHHANDQDYRDKFEKLISDSNISVIKSVQIGDIDSNLPTDTIRRKIRDDYLSDSTVTVVLIGAETWKRKHVDWEISSSIRDTKNSSRSGLIGILLPTYPRSSKDRYNQYTIPPRLYENLKEECEFAKIYNWNEDPKIIQKWIHEAFDRRNIIDPINTYPNFANNRTGTCWQY
ncbi:TIR domain-containing protein [Methanolobus sp. ZRKC5]|uniref:TIR domain-containing protein n=1 Tax=unclassified Methanolobus TaxID=2629569 RepID=UPI00313DCE7F